MLTTTKEDNRRCRLHHPHPHERCRLLLIDTGVAAASSPAQSPPPLPLRGQVDKYLDLIYYDERLSFDDLEVLQV